MPEQPSIASVGSWLKQYWWLAAIGVVVIVGTTLWLLPEEKAHVTGGTPDEVIGSIQSVAEENKPGAGQAIAAFVRDTNPRVREAAIVSGARFSGNAPLVRAAMKDPDENVRIAAITVLTRTDDPEAVADLGRIALDNHADAKSRVAALDGLIHADTPEAVVHITKVMKMAEPAVAKAAMDVLCARMQMDWWKKDLTWDEKVAIIEKKSYVWKAVNKAGS
ncbi:MAG: HEAT repeat domain-containing protein [Planctomycetota bacterium]|nr:HEAT repeat domain-containing protein [Planctomycetota bacterium]